ncbi:MAG: HAMP domain-containing histidine kinase [Oscillospiraceae bacterium]|nr:HAMP domain-containing histidine kinase [Oscillospiraceae bacterium]
MGTISKRENRAPFLFRSSQLRYAAAYVLVTSAVLLFLNIYAPIMIRELTFSAQRNAILDKAQLIVSDFSNCDRLDKESVWEIIQSIEDLHTARVVVTDAGANCLYDSQDSGGYQDRLVLYPEVAEALEGNDAVYIRYEPGQIISKAAMPIVAYNRIIGAVYLLERDQDQAALIDNLQITIFWISIGLEVLVSTFSILFAVLYSRRMGKLFVSVRKLHGGDYSVRLPERGHDELTRLAKAFNKLAARLDQSEEVRKQFVSNASHELKTPLASIKLLTDSILQNDMDRDTMREFVADVGNEADRLTRLSEKLLELTRLDSKPAENRELTPVRPVADRVLRMLIPLARKQEIRLNLDCPENIGVLASSDDLYQILFNLVENGIKYNTSNGEVSVRGFVIADSVVIQIEDTGMGIPDSEKPHVFERFYRVDKARSRKAGGSGLGLSIVSDMVQRNDGSVTLTDREGGGSCFRLSFPYYPLPEEELT